jgi:hypothetical protein
MRNVVKIVKATAIGLVFLLCTVPGFSQPESGDVYKEFTFIPEHGHFGELDPDCTREFPEDHWTNRPWMVIKTLDVELKKSIKAEMSIEYWGGHSGTSEQKFKINGNDWIYLPQPENTPTDPQCYFRTLLGNSSVAVPLEHLTEGKNDVQFTCGPQICYNFNWGFYWIYSFTIRVYYDPSVKHTEGIILPPGDDGVLEDHPEIAMELTEGDKSEHHVDFIGYYEDFDWEGNGLFRQWHYQTRQGKKVKHIGTSSKEPFKVTWNTKWLPDQDQPVRIAAVITNNKGYSYMTPEVGDLMFQRKERKVKMYKSLDVPEAFAVRVGRRKACSIVIDDDLEDAQTACLLLSTWSGKSDDGSIHEIIINGKRISDNFGRFQDYSYDFLSVPLEYIREGRNEISIYSVFEGHSLEINWPGPVLLIEF